MQIYTIPSGPIETNAYLLLGEGKKALLVDCPLHVMEAVDKILEREESVLSAILLTHGHWDHTGDLAAAQRGRDGTAVPVYAHPADRALIEEPAVMSAFMPPGMEIEGGTVDHWVEDGVRLDLAGETCEVRHVPGHCPGNVLFYFPAANAAFVGDALFRGSVGRYDLPGGDFETLERSIQTRIYTLPEATVVYPGHGPTTTVGEEKKTNPFVQASK